MSAADGDKPKPKRPPHVVIVGAGFGGLACAKALGGAPVFVTVIDRRNYHLFQPLLYQVATAALSPANIAVPIREVLRRHGNVRVVMGEVAGVDLERQEVSLANGRQIGFDRLVVATGSEYHHFGHDDWAAHAPGLKSLDEARAIRRRLLAAYEEAEAIRDPARQAALMTSVVVGGGPTGVEMAGAIAELVRWTLAGEFRHIDPKQSRIILAEAGPRILPGFTEPLGRFAERALADHGVTIMTDSPVEEVTAEGVRIAGEFIPAATIVWGAGVKASPAARWLGVETDRGGRIPVNPDLSVPGHANIFVIGDLALAVGDDGLPLPGLAQVAKQQGEHLGRALRRNLVRGAPMPPFRFRNRGNTAVIGRNAAVFDFGGRLFKGRLAWLLWALIHVYLLVGFGNRLLVSLQWVWRYFTHERSARLIS